jgi:FkbH-like protein
MNTLVALLSNVNIAPLQNALQQEGFEKVYVSGYNQWQSELLNPASGLNAAGADYVIMYIDAVEWKKGNSDVEEIIRSIRHYLANNTKGSILICDMVCNPLHAGTYATMPGWFERSANEQLYKLAENEVRVTIVPFMQLALRYGYNRLFDPKYWYLGRMKLSLDGNRLLSREIRWLTRAVEGKSRKVLVMDLDNTLWGGVLGEEGWQNIQLSEEGTGLIFKEMQQLIVELSQLGVLISICSKNNEADVREAIERNEHMQLSWNDFVAPRVNWLPKDENIRSIAQELNLGLDAFVFIDDNPVERTLVQESLPSVAVPQFPTDLTRLLQWMYEEVVYPYFARTTLTLEDRNKTLQYRRNAARESERNNFSFDEFVANLNIEIEVEIATEAGLSRIAQLTQKTNQFNMTMKRYTEADIIRMYGSDNWKLFTCRYRDKFGDEGIVGCFLIELEGDTVRIDNFLLSCRVLGRRAEFRMLDALKNQLHQLQVKKMVATYTPGERNQPAALVYEQYGFTTITSNEYKLQI